MLCCCHNRNPESKILPTVNPKLLYFKIEGFADADSVFKLPENIRRGIHDKFINAATDTVVYGKSAIYIWCSTMAAACSKYTGNISMNKDTIRLELINVGGVVCTEQNCYRLFYKIDNPSLDSFIIVKP